MRKGDGFGQPVNGTGEAAVDDGPPIGEELIEEAQEQEGSMAERVEELEAALASANAELEACSMRLEIERALMEVDTLDLETAAILTESSIRSMDEPDVGQAVSELRKRKPFLFGAGSVAGGPSSASATMAPSAHGLGGEGLGDMAERARTSGDRAALLRYLRCRRSH